MNTDLKIAKQQEVNHIPQDQINVAITQGSRDSQGRPRPQLAVIMRPYFTSQEFWAYWPRWMRQTLPQFVFNAQAKRYEAPIEELPKAVRALQEDWIVSLSEGAATYMEDFNDPADFGEYDWAKPECMV